MSMLTGTLGAAIFKIVADTKQFRVTLKQLKKNILAFAAVVAIGFGVKKIFDFGKAALQVSSDFNEVRNRFSAVFGQKLNKEAEDTANSIAKEFDLAGGTVRRMLADTGDLLVGLGFTRKEALRMAKQVAQLSGDLASFQDVEGGATVAAQRLTSMILGNTRAARESLKVFVLQNKAFNKQVNLLMRTKNLTELQARAEVFLERARKQSECSW